MEVAATETPQELAVLVAEATETAELELQTLAAAVLVTLQTQHWQPAEQVVLALWCFDTSAHNVVLAAL